MRDFPVTHLPVKKDKVSIIGQEPRNKDMNASGRVFCCLPHSEIDVSIAKSSSI